MKKDSDMIFNTGNLVFHISNETASDIATKNIRPYNPEYKALVEAAREVKSQKFFGDVDIAVLAKDYPFVPFKYQIENVNAMLNRFEGRGVFGDQVGLGKTVEALMTAHAMFESGAIRNALLVIPEKTKDGWIGEINEKFPKIFAIYDSTQNGIENDIECLKATFGEMSKDKKNAEHVENTLYIVTDTMLKNNIDDLFDELQSSHMSQYKNPINSHDKSKFSELKDKLDAIDLNSLVDYIDKTLIEYGYDTDTSFKLLSYDNSTEAKLAYIIDLLTETKNRVVKIRPRATNKSYKEQLINRIDHYIREFQNRKKEFDIQFEERTKYDLNNFISSATKPVADPTIDLMIIDEIHSFYESDEGIANTKRETISKYKKTAMDNIAKLEKKFCVLLSATPIRTKLADIFDLVYLTDSKRFGNTKIDALDYFYDTICRVSRDEPNPLNEIFTENDMARRNNFFGLINNFFTRKRIREISNDMTGLANGDLPLYTNLQTAIGEELLKSLEADIYQKRKLMYMQSTYAEPDAAELALEDCLAWQKGTYIGKFDTKHMRAAIDAAIIDKLKMRGTNEITDKAQRHQAYSAVNWNRREKMGIAFNVDDNDHELIKICNTLFGSNFSDSLKRATKAVLLTQRLRAVNDSLHTTESTAMDGFYIASLENQPDDISDNKKNRVFLMEKIVDPFLGGLCYDATLCYMSKSLENVRRNSRQEIGQAMANKYKLTAKDDTHEYTVVRDSKETTVKIKNYNQITIVDEQHQAGINYQDYRTFIFAHMDLNGERLLEPVDIEQWIGRIHRTGQVKSCRIVTVLTTIMKNPSRNPDSEFLKWYYNILADPQGLDLYGNNTPDIAFLQPIIVDILRAKLCELKEKHDIRVIIKKTKLTNEEDFQNYSFSELMEFCYYLNQSRLPKMDVQHQIRELCKITEFGKATSEN